jgi:DNA-binding response OmpR family regulator/anti-sigma regulatory factor (Ser/Thr protein kinase)
VKPAVLIVDDSLTVRMDLAEAFEPAGFTVTLAGTAEAARTALRETTFALVVLDVLLPDGSGIDLLAEIKSTAATVPVMLLSTEAEVRDRIRGLQRGADDYVGKPYDPAYVVARARELVRPGVVERPADAPATILVIDDSPTFRGALEVALGAAGYAVITAKTGEEGLRAAVDARPAAVIVDGVLPGIDGATVIRRMRVDAALRRTPCLLLTASEDRREELTALEAGADAFVRKEEDPGIILARLVALLRSAGAPSAVVSTSSLLGPKKILAVDDSITYLQELAEQLRQEGYDVALARSGEEALELLAVERVDCILLDLVMPGLSGKETCQRIKSSPEWRDIPLVMLTALEERSAMIEAINAGVDDYITKSSDFAVLKARLGAQLRRKQFEDENRQIRERLLRKELEATEARAARELAETRVALLADLERQNAELEQAKAQEHEAHEALKRAQSHLVQSEKLAALGQMVAGVAHEINNPLSFVINNVVVLDRDVGSLRDLLSLYVEGHEPLAREGPELLARIHALRERIDADYTVGNLGHLFARAREGLRRIEQIVLDLRGFARLDQGDQQEADLNAGVTSTVNIARGRAVRKSLEIVVEPGELPMVSCHPAKINQVILNLIANAIDASPENGRVTVRTWAGDGHVAIEVTDTGGGIDPTIRERVFDPFFTTKPIGEGTGLGLSISYGIVHEHGGSIEIDSAAGQGARFVVRLPVRARAAYRSGHVDPASSATPS